MTTMLLDCTLRDGGYYTNWDFDIQLVDAYINAMNQLPIQYLEVGYRNNPSDDYLGKFGYTPVSVLRHLRETCTKKLVVMLNEKSTKPEDLDILLKPIVGLADMIRIAIDPKNFNRAVVLAKAVKAMGFEVGFNCMYMSKWSSEYEGFLSKLNVLNGWATYSVWWTVSVVSHQRMLPIFIMRYAKTQLFRLGFTVTTTCS